MSSERFLQGQTIPYEVYFVDAFSAAITDATGVITIRRKSNDEYWNQTGTTWQTAVVQNAMTEIDETNSPGFWKFDFDTTVGDDDDEYVAHAIDTSGNADNVPAPRIDFVGDYVETALAALEVSVAKILGLSHENFVMEPTEFSSDDQMTAGNVRVYDTAANATTDNGTTGLTNSYTITSPRISGQLQKFSMVLD